MPTYLFLCVYAPSDALLLPICFHWSVTVWSLNRAEVCFSILESFNNCIGVKLVFSLYDPFGCHIWGRGCGPFAGLLSCWNGVKKSSDGAVNLRIRFWPALWHNFWPIFRAEYLGILWLVSCGFVVVWKRTLRAFQWCQDRMNLMPECRDIASWNLCKKYGL